jgi:hypothetical protein
MKETFEHVIWIEKNIIESKNIIELINKLSPNSKEPNCDKCKYYESYWDSEENSYNNTCSHSGSYETIEKYFKCPITGHTLTSFGWKME